jgi:hypothetical protein
MSSSGQQLFFKEYEKHAQENIVSNMLNTGAIHSFINFFNNHLVKKECDLILFDDILFTFDYFGNDASLPFTTLIVTKIDKKLEFEVQSNVLKKVASSISKEFCECYNEVMVEKKNEIEYFSPFTKKCDLLLHNFASSLESVSINNF